MYSLNIQDENVYFKDIKLQHLPQILEWYNKVDEYKYATGIDAPITLKAMTEKYAEVAICCSEFFVGVYSKLDGNMIGIFKGSIKFEEKDAVWISSLVIDTRYQRRGYGSAAIKLLFGYLKEKSRINSAYLSVIEENIQGLTFWNKHCFKEYRRIEKKDGKPNIIIMYKKI